MNKIEIKKYEFKHLKDPRNILVSACETMGISFNDLKLYLESKINEPLYFDNLSSGHWYLACRILKIPFGSESYNIGYNKDLHLQLIQSTSRFSSTK